MSLLCVALLRNGDARFCRRGCLKGSELAFSITGWRLLILLKTSLAGRAALTAAEAPRKILREVVNFILIVSGGIE